MQAPNQSSTVLIRSEMKMKDLLISSEWLEGANGLDEERNKMKKVQACHVM